MRAAACLAALLVLAAPAKADPRCARLGQPSYSATRITLGPGAPPPVQVFFAEGRMRIEAPSPHGGPGRLVTLLGPEGRIVFDTAANPPVALRLPAPPRPPIPPEALRQREERGREGVTLITELQEEGGRWRETERVLCRPDGVLLRARQMAPQGGQLVATEFRQEDIRLGPQDPALFRPPPGFALREPPPMPPGAGPPGAGQRR
jgi:hypothetical protein